MNYIEALRTLELLGVPNPDSGVAADFPKTAFAGFTGTMAAALAANSTVFCLVNLGPAESKGAITWLHLHYTCLAGFTTPVTAGRRLSLKRGSYSQLPSGGTDVDISCEQVTSEDMLWSGKVATTAALTMTGTTYETPTRARLMLSHCGNAGQDYDEIWTFDDLFEVPAGYLVGIVAPAAFDAGGTWQLSVKGGAIQLPTLVTPE